MFQYILFDLDGTVLDTQEAILASFDYALKARLNINVAREDLLKIFGEPLHQQMSYFSPEQADSLCQAYREHYAIYSGAVTKPFPEVIEVLSELKKLKIPIGIVTNKARQPAEKALREQNILPLIDLLIGRDEVSQAKPHPEALFTGIKLLNADPAKTLMVGDSPLDIEAAHRAKIKSALVGWSIFSDERFLNNPPDYYLKQMSDLLNLIEADVA